MTLDQTIAWLVQHGDSGWAMALICVFFFVSIGLPVIVLIVVINTLLGHSGRRDG